MAAIFGCRVGVAAVTVVARVHGLARVPRRLDNVLPDAVQTGTLKGAETALKHHSSTLFLFCILGVCLNVSVEVLPGSGRIFAPVAPETPGAVLRVAFFLVPREFVSPLAAKFARVTLQVLVRVTEKVLLEPRHVRPPIGATGVITDVLVLPLLLAVTLLVALKAPVRRQHLIADLALFRLKVSSAPVQLEQLVALARYVVALIATENLGAGTGVCHLHVSRESVV